MTQQLDPSFDQHSTPTQVGHPGVDARYAPYPTPSYGAQPYGAQPYDAQPYDAQPYDAQPYDAQPYGAPAYGAQPYGPPPPPTRRFGAGAVIGGVALVAALLAGVGTGAYFLASDPAPVAAPVVSAAPSAPVAPAAPTVPAAPTAPSAPAAPAAVPSGAATTDPTLTTVFPASAGSDCGPYTPTAGEYVTSTGHQAVEVRACASGSGKEGVVFTRWASTSDAAAVVSDQARRTTSIDGKDTWTMGGASQGDWHEARQADGSCSGFLDYRSGPYAVVFRAPTCSGVEQLFQQTTLPDDATLPR